MQVDIEKRILDIATSVYENRTKKITGQIMQDTLVALVKDLASAINLNDDETGKEFGIVKGNITSNANAIAKNTDEINLNKEGISSNKEATAKNATDIKRNADLIAELQELTQSGWVFEDIVKTADSPREAVPTNKPYYFAIEKGTYANFGGVVMQEEGLAIIKWDGAKWVIKQMLYVSQKSFGEQNVVPSNAQLSSKLTIGRHGKNLFNKDSVIKGFFLRPDGELGKNDAYCVSDYIGVTPNEHLSCNGNYTRTIYKHFYDENYNYVSSEPMTEHIKIIIPSNVYYVRFTFYSDDRIDSVQVEKGDELTQFEPYNAYIQKRSIVEDKLADGSVSERALAKDSVTSGKIADSSVTERKIADDSITENKIKDNSISDNKIPQKEITKDKIRFISSNNLVNKEDEDVALGSFLKDDGTLGLSASYNTSGYIYVRPLTKYSLGVRGDESVQSMGRFINFYDKNKNVISQETNSRGFTTGENVHYVRITFYSAKWDIAQLTRTDERIYHENYFEHIDNCLIDNILNFNSFRGSKEGFGKNSSIKLPFCNSRKNIQLSATIEGTIERVLFGYGYSEVFGYWVELTPTKAKVFRQDGTQVLVDEFEHGLVLKERTFISIHTILKVPYNTANLVIESGGQYFEKEITFWGGGKPFILNKGVNPINAKISFSPADSLMPIWLFGDSYFSYTDSRRWTYYIISKWGYRNELISAVPGGTSLLEIDSFQNLLMCGTPKFAVWCLGMNDGSDTQDAPSAQWLTNVVKFIEICKNKGIKPILATIPTTPKILNEQKNAWVRNSGYRYIDFAKSVGANAEGIWYDGMLAADQIHPTNEGAKNLAMQVLLDLPEITNS